jgi:RNA polymerase sigma-54 factor
MSGPGFSHDLRQRQTQSLVLAPQLRHSLKILQVAALDLRSVIQEELQSNPTLEELPMEDVSLDNPAPEETPPIKLRFLQQSRQRLRRSLARPGRTRGENRDEMDFSKDKEFEILGKLDEDWRDHMASAGGAQPYTSEDAESASTSSTRSSASLRCRSTSCSRPR